MRDNRTRVRRCLGKESDDELALAVDQEEKLEPVPVTVAILSSVYGGYDKVYQPSEQFIPCDFIMVSDEPIQQSRIVGRSRWQNIVEPNPRVPPRLASRVAKCNPWLYTDADVVIWVDGNIEITSPFFAEWCLAYLKDNLICQTHLEHFSIWDEVGDTVNVPKFADDPLREQATSYIRSGYPELYGTWWCGIMVRRRECPAFGDQWLAEMVRWSCHDQISHSYLMWKNRLIPENLITRFEGEIGKIPGVLDADGWRFEHYNRWIHNSRVT